MRAAVLHLTFAGLGATRAETGAMDGNPASEGVTRRLGYEANGDAIHLVDGRRRREQRFVLTREAWEQQDRIDVDITGLDRCRPLLGAVDQPTS